MAGAQGSHHAPRRAGRRPQGQSAPQSLKVVRRQRRERTSAEGRRHRRTDLASASHFRLVLCWRSVPGVRRCPWRLWPRGHRPEEPLRLPSRCAGRRARCRAIQNRGYAVALRTPLVSGLRPANCRRSARPLELLACLPRRRARSGPDRETPASCGGQRCVAGAVPGRPRRLRNRAAQRG